MDQKQGITMNMAGSICAIYVIASLFICSVQAGAIRRTDLQEGAELLPNPRFVDQAAGWLLREALPDPMAHHGSSDGVSLSGGKPGEGALPYVGIKIEAAPCDHVLRLTLYLKADSKGQSILVNSFGYDEKNGTTASSSISFALQKGRWKLISTDLLLPLGTRKLTIWVINGTPHPVLVSDAHLNVGKYKKAILHDLNGPGVIRAMAQAAVRPTKPGQIGTVTFPIPGLYRDQIPLTFQVRAQPANALKSYRRKRRPDGINWVCEVTVAPPEAGAIVQWEGLVLAEGHEEAPPPRATRPEAPAEAAAWTRSTACVQSADPSIRRKAAELAKGADDIEAYVRRVIAFTASNRGTGAPFDALDARRALACGGSCTNRANLAVALLRAHGIPARSVSHLPTWAPKLYEHWLVEYWHPGAGWVRVEATLNQFQPPPWRIAVLAVSSPDDEDKAFDPVHLRYVMPGAAYLSVCELSPELVAADLFSDDATNQAACEMRLTGTQEELDALFSTAKQAFTHLVEQEKTGRISDDRVAHVMAGLQSGKASDLTAVLPH